ncbi:MAG: metal-binding protein [Cyanobacteria bacterium J06631_6]
MPSGVVHDRITIWLLPWVVGLTYCMSSSAEITLILSCGYVFSGMMFGPDLDISSLQYKRWGMIRGIWLPYRKFFRHRSLFSHGFIIGTCVRLGYLFSIIAVLGILGVAIAQACFGFTWNWQEFVGQKLHLITQEYPQETLALFVGLEIGAMSHSISDWYSSYQKRRLKTKSSKVKAKTRIKKLRRAKIYQKKK